MPEPVPPYPTKNCNDNVDTTADTPWLIHHLDHFYKFSPAGYLIEDGEITMGKEEAEE